MSVDNERFKMMKVCLPPIENGNASIEVKQEVTSPKEDTYVSKMDFSIKGVHFTMPTQEIHTVYPPVNATGNYGNSVAHVTFKKKSFPWENPIDPKLKRNMLGEDIEVLPWLALICISDDKNIRPEEIKISNLFERHEGIFYPLKEMPVCSEKPDDICKVIDIPRDLYGAIMPRVTEIEYLSHVKLIDMYHKTDEMVSMDGYFSVVVSNRFIPSGDEDVKGNTMHLVSLEGFENYLPEGSRYEEIPEGEKVRLVSLYSWKVFSTNQGEVDFREIMNNIDVGPFALASNKDFEGDSEMFKRGFVPVKHITRTGEDTISLYRSPLLPYVTDEVSDDKPHTADGYLIYDPVNGIMDTSYSAAWQLGRLLMLKDKAIASLLLEWKKETMRSIHRRANENVFRSKMTNAMGMKDGDVVDYWVHTLAGPMMENELIAPVSRDYKGRNKGDIK